jgi:hypothetical protein
VKSCLWVSKKCQVGRLMSSFIRILLLLKCDRFDVTKHLKNGLVEINNSCNTCQYDSFSVVNMYVNWLMAA